MADKETKYIVSSMKITLNVLIVLVVSAVLLLFNFFVIDGVGDGKAHDLAYWMKKVMTAVGTFLIMIGTANITEESLKRKNKSYNDRLKALDNNYQDVNEKALTERLDFYILQKNIHAKYMAFVKKYKKKLLHIKMDEKHKAKREAIEQKLLMTPDEVWASPEKIKYPEITYSLLIAGATDVSAREDEDDLQTHRISLVFKKLLWKATALIGAALYLPELISHFENFSLSSILPLCIRIATILWAFYSGVCFGYTMLDRLLVVLKRKIKVFSEFDARTNDITLTDDKRYLIVYEKDGQVEKIKAKYNDNVCVSARACEKPQAVVNAEQVITEPPKPSQNALQQVVADINHPITPGNFVSRVIQRHIENRVNQA